MIISATILHILFRTNKLCNSLFTPISSTVDSRILTVMKLYNNNNNNNNNNNF